MASARRSRAAWLWVLAGCGGGDGHDHASSGAGAHDHVAPHGGLLVPLGDEEAHVELLLDPEHGELALWLLDAEAERPLRSAQDAIVVHLARGPVTLAPVASALTGETVGDTSEFRASGPGLKGAVLEGTIERIEVLGNVHAAVPIEAEAGGR